MAFPGRTDGAQIVCRYLTSQWTPSKAKLSTCCRWSRTKQMPMSIITYAHRYSKHLSQRFRRRLPSCAFRKEPYTGDRPPRHQKLLTAAMLASFDSLNLDSRRPRGPGRHYTSIVGEWCGKSRRLCRVHATVRAFVCNMIRSDIHKHLLVRGAGRLLGARTTCFTRLGTGLELAQRLSAEFRCFQPRSAKANGPHDAGVRSSELFACCMVRESQRCGVFL